MFPEVMLIVTDNRKKTAFRMQEVFTKHGCIIQTRIGLHESTKLCSDAALIILQLTGMKKEILQLKKELNKIKGVKARLFEPSKF